MSDSESQSAPPPMTRLMAWRGADRVHGRPWALLGLALAGYLALHFHLAAHFIRTTNLDLTRTDQAAYLAQAWNGRSDPWPLRSDGVRNNLWPWLAAKTWLKDGMDDVTDPLARAQLEPHFISGKWFNVWLTAAFIAVFTLACARFFPLIPALNLMLLAGLGVLLPRAVWFQPEALFFMLFFAVWLGCWRLLIANPLWLYALTGVLTGLAWLTKPSTAPLLAVFIGAGALRFLAACRPRVCGPGRTPAAGWSWRRHLAGMAVLLAGHGAVVAPMAVRSARVYHDPFFSFPKYWMWQDDWEAECEPLVAKTQRGRTLYLLPKSELPSAGKWLREHGWGKFGARLAHGTMAKLENLLTPDKAFWKWDLPKRNWSRLLADRGAYLGIPLALLLALAGMARWRGVPVLDRAGAIEAVLFIAGAFCLYTLAYGWYHPIGRGDRFMMGLYLPMLFAIVWAVERLRRRLDFGPAHLLTAAVHCFILGCLLTRVAQFLIHPAVRTP